MMKYEKGIIIDDNYLDIPFVSLKRRADFLDKYAERAEDGDLLRELIGVYYNFDLTVGSSSDFGKTDYDWFWEFMTKPVEYRQFCIPTKDGYYDFRGYISSVSDEYKKILTNRAEFANFTCKMTAKMPSRRPK